MTKFVLLVFSDSQINSIEVSWVENVSSYNVQEEREILMSHLHKDLSLLPSQLHRGASSFLGLPGHSLS